MLVRFILVIKLTIITGCNDSLTSIKSFSDYSYEDFCSTQQLKCKKKQPNKLYPSIEEFSALIQIISALGRYGSNGIAFIRSDLKDRNLLKAIEKMSLTAELEVFKKHIESTALNRISIENGIIALSHDHATETSNASGLIIRREKRVTVEIDNENILITGMKIGTPYTAAQSIRSISYQGSGDITLITELLTITGIPLNMIFSEFFPLLNFTAKAKFTDVLEALPDLNDWFFKPHRSVTIGKDFFNVAASQITALAGEKFGRELSKILSIIEGLEIGDLSPYMRFEVDGLKNLVCNMKPGTSPRNFLSFTENLETYDVSRAGKNKVKLESSGIPTKTVIMNKLLDIDTSRVILKKEGLEIRNIPVVRKFTIPWQNFGPSKLYLKCQFQ